MLQELSSYTIRKATSYDIEQIALLEIRSAQYESRLAPLNYTVSELVKLWQQRLKDSRFYIFVATQESVLLGFMAIIAPLKAEGFIQAIYVDPLYFKKGIGSALLSIADRIFSLRQCPRAKLFVEPLNDSGIRFYLKAGYLNTNQKFRHLKVFVKEFSSC